VTGRPFTYRNPDGSINLEAALGPALRHYVAMMVSGTGTMHVLDREGPGDPEGQLVRHGYGRPASASSRGEVAVLPEFSWDVCAYYLLLGVHWRASRGEIRRAYLAACTRDGGQVQDERLTYVLSQLLDPATRRAYDLTALGDAFLPDREIQAAIRRAAVREAARRRAQGAREATADEVMEEMGLVTRPSSPEAGEEQEERAEGPGAPPESSWAMDWGYYSLLAPDGPVSPDPALLEAWQGMLAAALRKRGIVMGFAVAQGAEGSPLVLRNTNEACIFVMTEKGASPQQAEMAIEMGISLGIVAESSKRRKLNGLRARRTRQGRAGRRRGAQFRFPPGRHHAPEGRGHGLFPVRIP
jgi:hypothetical protein